MFKLTRFRSRFRSVFVKVCFTDTWYVHFPNLWLPFKNCLGSSVPAAAYFQSHTCYRDTPRQETTSTCHNQQMTWLRRGALARKHPCKGLPAVDYRVGRAAEWKRAQSQPDKERPDNYTQVKYTGSGAALLKLTPLKHAEVSVIHNRQEFNSPCSDLYFRKEIKPGCVVCYLICRAFQTRAGWFWAALYWSWNENKEKFSFLCPLLLFLLPGFDPHWPRHVSFPVSLMLLQPSVWTQ